MDDMNTSENENNKCIVAPISDEMCDFIGVDKNSERSRMDVTIYLNSYIKKHNLQNPENMRHIVLDDTLKKLFDVEDGEIFSYFNMQKYINKHFV